MEYSLEQILDALPTDGNRLLFLKRIYKPGNSQIIDHILALSPDDSEIFRSEASYSLSDDANKKLGEKIAKERFNTFAKKFVDSSLRKPHSYFISELINWGNKEIALYALSSLKESNALNMLEQAEKIIDHFGFEEDKRQIKGKIYEIIKNDKENIYTAATIASELGKYNEAINYYLSQGYGGTFKAFEIAENHAPERINEIAKVAFNSYKPNQYWNSEMYVKGARTLGKVNKAMKVLKNETSKKVDKDSFTYQSMVKSLLDLNLIDDAKVLAKKIESHEYESSSKDYYDSNNLNILAEILLMVGDKEGAIKAYNKKIVIQKKDHHSSHFLGDYDKIFELSGDKSILFKKIEIYAKNGEYNQAADTARKMGYNKLAAIYDVIQTMIPQK